jgi:2-oxoglutarate ferredoxin oxidoreductase subunit delta
MNDGVVSTGTIVIDVERCKGCELCIDACVPGVLAMTEHERNSTGFLFPLLSAGCIACRACARVCPDYVFQVWKFDDPVVTPDDPIVASSVSPGEGE